MSLPVTTPLFSVVGDAVFTARVVVVTARACFRRIVGDEVFARTADAVVIVEALACIIVSLDVCLSMHELDRTRVGVTTTV